MTSRAGRDLSARLPDINLDAFHWMAQSEGIVYARYLRPGTEADDGVDREGIVGVHVLGTPVTQDRVLHRTDPSEGEAIPLVELSSDRRFVLFKDYLGFDSRVWILDLQDPERPRFDASPVAWGADREGQTVLIGSVGSTLYLHTNRSASNFQVVAVNGTDPTEWRTVVPETKHLLEHALVVGGHLVTAYRRDAKSALALHTLDGTALRDIGLPATGSAFALSGGADTPALTFGFDSFAHPPAAYQYDISSGRTVRLGLSQGSIDPNDYVTRQVFFASEDGTRVPMFITHRADRPANDATPTLLYGYGSAGRVMEPVFSNEWFSWIEAGGILAVANVRGGGEYGEAWRRAGARANKQNTYDDFIAAAEYLIREGYTTPEHLAINGVSDGGLLVGAVMTQRPDLFAAALPEAGVLDALRFPSFTVGQHWGALYGRSVGPGRVRLALRLVAAARPPRRHLLPRHARHDGGQRRPRPPEPVLQVRGAPASGSRLRPARAPAHLCHRRPCRRRRRERQDSAQCRSPGLCSPPHGPEDAELSERALYRYNAACYHPSTQLG